MTEGSYALENLTWREVGRILARDSRLLFPVGALEQHGAHLPLGTSTFIAETLARDASEEHGVLLAPTLAYGVVMSHPGRFAGQTGVGRKTLHRAVNELFARWEDHGVSEFVAITAHRFEPHLDALLMALTSDSLTTVIDLYRIDVSDLLESPPHLEHAGELETSLMRHLAPERVREDEIEMARVPPGRARTYMRGGMPTPPAGSPGFVGRPDLATAEKGRLIYERYRAALRSVLGRP
ncbi:MAG TPA: creatininase family protein [Longimicrobiales bacterium]|nr:creatininase family protein [Longimicrobiales bacterium]